MSRAWADRDKFHWAYLWVATSVGAVFLWFLTLSFGMRRFGGMDLSHLINLGYRLYLGQKPYLDFYVNSPPLFYLGSKWALQLFGLKWSAFVKISAIFSVLSFILHVLLLMQIEFFGMGRFKKAILAWSVAFVCQLCAMVSVAYWWYNPTTAIVGALFITAVFGFFQKPNTTSRFFWVLLSAFWLAIAKPNVTGPLFVTAIVSILLLSASSFKEWFTIQLRLVFIVLLLSILLALFFNAQGIPLSDLFESYVSASGRGIPTWARFKQDMPLRVNQLWIFLILLMTAPIILKTVWALKDLKKGRKETASFSKMVLVWGSAATAYIAFFTNGEPKLTDFPLLLMPLTLVELCGFTRTPIRTAFKANQFFILVLVLLGAVSLYFGNNRLRARVIDEIAHGEREIDLSEKNKFFEGFYGTPILQQIIEEIDYELKDYQLNLSQGTPVRKPKVFFGLRMEFAYAAYEIEPEKGFPVYWWSPGVSFPENKIDAILNTFYNANFDLIIFRKKEYSYIPEPILKYVTKNYNCFERDSITVYRRKN